MKQILLRIAALLLILVLAGCAAAPAEVPVSTEIPETTAPVVPLVHGFGGFEKRSSRLYTTGVCRSVEFHRFAFRLWLFVHFVVRLDWHDTHRNSPILLGNDGSHPCDVFARLDWL